MNMCYCALLKVIFSFLFVSMNTIILLDLLTSLLLWYFETLDGCIL